jgi:hypothetical protein
MGFTRSAVCEISIRERRLVAHRRVAKVSRTPFLFLNLSGDRTLERVCLGRHLEQEHPGLAMVRRLRLSERPGMVTAISRLRRTWPLPITVFLAFWSWLSARRLLAARSTRCERMRRSLHPKCVTGSGQSEHLSASFTPVERWHHRAARSERAVRPARKRSGTRVPAANWLPVYEGVLIRATFRACLPNLTNSNGQHSRGRFVWDLESVGAGFRFGLDLWLRHREPDGGVSLPGRNRPSLGFGCSRVESTRSRLASISCVE